MEDQLNVTDLDAVTLFESRDVGVGQIALAIEDGAIAAETAQNESVRLLIVHHRSVLARDDVRTRAVLQVQKLLAGHCVHCSAGLSSHDQGRLHHQAVAL